jgi:hypothetical protein
VIYPGSAPVGNATLVVANVLTCNKHSPNTVHYAAGHLKQDVTQSLATSHI